MFKTRVDKGWNITAGDSLLTIAVLDAGFQIDHEDLIESLWTNEAEANGNPGEDDDGNGYVDDIHAWDFAENDNNVEPSASLQQHGTAVAGIAGASTDNGKGIAGAAGGRPGSRPKLLLLRVHQISNIGPAIEYAWRAGADIVNMSFGGYGDAGGAGSVAIDSVFANGALLFAAIGNNGMSNPAFILFPATHPDVIAVGSTDENDVRICYSNYGSYLDLMAPSASKNCPVSPEPLIWTTDNYGLIPWGYNPGYSGCPAGACFAVPPENDRYFGGWDGTSAACPLAAAVGGLLKSHMPMLTGSQLRDRLLASAIDLGVQGRDDEYGYGRVDAYRALTEWGTIAGNVTWGPSDTHEGTRYISGDLTIAAGATLTIMPGTIIKIANDDDLQSGSDPSTVEIKVLGTLIANGTATEPIVFESWAQPATAGDWAGIYFDGQSGGGTFNHCVIKHAECAIESYVPLAIRNSEIDSCSYAGVVSKDGGAFIRNCTFTDPGTFGLFLATGSSVVRNTVIDGASTAGCHVESSADLTLRGSTVKNGDTGLYVSGSASVDVDSTCYVWINDTGFHFYNAGSSSTIKSCGITWNASTAILCDNSSPRIESNTLAHNGSGIYCSNSSSPVIEANKMQTSGNMVTATSSSRPDVGHSSPSGGQSAGNNKIAFSDKYVVNYTDSTIYAQNNGWNVTTPPCNPPANKFTGTVDRSDPNCESFPLFPRGEAEPEPSESFVFQLPPPTASEAGKKVVTGLVSIVPNPFNPTTTIHYSLAVRGAVEIKIFDVGGRLVQILANETQVAGAHAALWNGTDRRGSPVASGIYFVRMAAAGQVFTRKMVLLK